MSTPNKLKSKVKLRRVIVIFYNLTIKLIIEFPIAKICDAISNEFN